jgi:hypothetical protein
MQIRNDAKTHATPMILIIAFHLLESKPGSRILVPMTAPGCRA